MQKMTGKELFYLIFIYEIGSAILLDPAKEAMKDAWLAILLGYIAAIPLFMMYVALTKVSGRKTLIGILITLLGKKAGSLASFMYILYFLYICSRVLRDFGELLIITAYNETFLIVISSFMMLAVMYFSIKPFKITASAAAPMFYWITIPFVLVVMFEFMSGIVNVEEILPVAEHGPLPILKTIFPTVLTFPFGEMVVFTMFYPLAEKGIRYLKITLLSILASAFVLSLTAFLHTSILGPKLTKNFIFPILATVSLINISDFIQRLDSLVVILMIVVGFIKILLFFAAAVRGTCEVTETKNPVPVSLVYGLGVILASLFIANTQYEHFQEGLAIVPLFLHVPFQIFFPALLLLGVWLKNRKKRSKYEPYKEI